MVGNTINKYNIYFNNFGLLKAKTQEQGTIDIYEQEDGTKIAVEYCDYMRDDDNARFFKAFKSEALDMILKGGYEAKYAPPKPCDFEDKDIVFRYFIDFDNEILQCEIVQVGEDVFTYIHRKTTPIKDRRKDLIFCQEWSEQRNIRRNILNDFDKIGRKIK